MKGWPIYRGGSLAVVLCFRLSTIYIISTSRLLTFLQQRRRTMAEPKKKPNGETPTMPENKKKTNGETPAPVPSNGSKFAAKFNKLINVCTDLKNDSEGAVDYEKTLEENTAVKAALKKSDDEVIRLNTEIQKLEQLKDLPGRLQQETRRIRL